MSAVHSMNAKLPTVPRAEVIMMTPAMATALWARNHSNRKFRQYHAERLLRLIVGNAKGTRWRFNGDTIKLDPDGFVQDGQHRLWAIMQSNRPVMVVVVYGVERKAFATIDTGRLPRSFADVVALAIGNSEVKHAPQIGTAVAWLCRWDRGAIGTNNTGTPEWRVENEEIEEKFQEHPKIADMVATCQEFRGLIAPPTLAFFCYLLGIKGRADLADQMLTVLRNPSVAIDNPFYQLHLALTKSRAKRRNPVTTIAWLVKAANYAARGQGIGILQWRGTGYRPEPFPQLEV